MPKRRAALPRKFYGPWGHPKKLLWRTLGILAFQIEQLEAWALKEQEKMETGLPFDTNPQVLKQTLAIIKELYELSKLQEKAELEELRELDELTDEELDEKLQRNDLGTGPKSEETGEGDDTQ